MSFLKELTDKGATIAWSTVAAHPSLIALGTKDSGGGSGFEDHGGELELHKLDFSQETDAGGGGGGGAGAGTLLGKVKTTARFATLAWSEMATKQAEYPYGLIAGGMGDGTVNVWDPAKLVASHPQPQVASVARHSGPVTGLNFNPHKSSSHLLASGGADSEVFIMALDRPDAPTVFVPGPKPNTSRHTAEVTKVSWNSQVSHIMATAAQNGSCIVWDLKQKKPWCELRDPNRAPITDVAWNPDQGQHLVTASGDDNNPVLKLWDLRSSTTLPLATLSGHSEGVLSVAWCPYDASLLMSCAKDNRTLLWDLFSLKPVYELPPGAGAELPQENAQMFGGYGKTAQRRYQVSWSPHIPAVVSTCSFDRKVQLFSMNGANTSNGRAPKWHRRPAGASFAFGGRLVSFSATGGDAAAGNAAVGQQGAGGGGGGTKTVKISSVKEDAAFVAASRRFEEAMATQGFRGFCQEKEASAATAHERRVWQFMQVIFEKNARNQLLAHLGFDGETVAKQAAEFVAASGGRQDNGGSLLPPPRRATSPNAGGGSILDDESEGAGGDGIPAESELADAMAGVDLDETKFSKPGGSSGGLFSGALPGVVGGGAGGGGGSNGQPLSKEAEAVIKRSLLVGNFEAAVQCCMSTGNMADAMLLASCGGADLWAKTQAQYFARESHQRPFLKVVNAIIKSELGVLVEASDLGQWQETLAILSTYAKQEEFPTLCEALASRLETEAGDRKSANLCYMCAVKVPKTVEMWAEELKSANAAIDGGTDTKALQEFVEKVSVFTQEPNDPPGEEVSAIFAEYAGILASEGETETAFKYIKGQGQNGAVLQDRLYHSAPHAAGTPAPPFPFERARVGVSPQSVVGGGSGAGVGGGGANGAAAGGGGAGYARARSDPRGSTAAGGGGDALPPGWTQMMDPSRNIPYYCNTATGETQWERPAPPPAATTRAVPSPHAPRMPQATSSPYNRANPAAAAAAAAAGATASFPPSPVKPGYTGPISALTAGGAAFGRPQQHHHPQQQQQQQQHQQQQHQQQHQQHQRQYSNPMASGGVAAPYAGLGGATMMNAGPGGGGGGGAYPPAAAGGPAGGMSASSSPYQQGGFVGGGAPGGAGGYPGGGGFPGDAGGSNRMRPGGGAGVGPGGAPGGAVHSPMRGMREGSGAGGMMPSSSPSPPGAPPPAPTSTASAASSVAAAAPAPPPPSDAESQAVVSALNGMLGALSEAPLSPPEKKMLGDVTKAVGILFGKMGRGQVEQETLTKVGQLVESLQARDIKRAGAVQQGLANSAWASHKDWLKGLKYLTTLVSRRLV